MEVLEKHLSMERSGRLASIDSRIFTSIRSYFSHKNYLLMMTYKFGFNYRSYDLALSIFDIVVRNIYLLAHDIKLYLQISLYIASKAIDITSSTSIIKSIRTREKLEENRLEEIELEIFKILNYNVYLPIGSYFLDILRDRLEEEGINLSEDVVTISRYFYYISTFISSMLEYNPSIVASSSLYLGFMNNGNDISYTLSRLINCNQSQIKYLASLISEYYNDIKGNRNISLYVSFYSEDVLSSYFMDLKDFYTEEIQDKPDISDIVRVEYRNTYIDRNHNMDILESIGEGGFSEVFKVKFDGETKALKKMFCGNKHKGLNFSDIIELSILKLANNSNIIECSSIEISIEDNRMCAQVILELMSDDLYNMVEDHRLNIQTVKRYSLQLFNAVKYLNDLGIIHGDIKLDNILVKGEDIKLADFGLSNLYNVSDENKYSELYTPMYRPIELLLGEDIYSYETDVWACGIIVIEMFISSKLLWDYVGKDKSKLLRRVIQIIGVDDYLTLSDLPEFSISYIYDSDQNIALAIENNMMFEEVKERLITNNDHDNIYDLVMEYIFVRDHEQLKENLEDLPDWEDWYLYIEEINFTHEYNIKDKHLLDLLWNTITIPQRRYTIERCINHPWFMT